MRVPPVYGTSAYKYEQKVVTTRQTVKKRVKAHKKRTAKNILSIAVVTVLAFCLLGRNAYITEKSTQLSKLKEEYETINSRVVGKECELEKKIDLKSIAMKATAELCMQTPEKHQLVYINMQNEDYAEGAPKSRISFFATIQGTLSRVMEYFG
jgi:hypothetical protein